MGIRINYGIKTGYNEAFIINGKKKDELIAQDPKSAEILKPVLRGKDIKRYKAEFADLWLIYIPWHFPLNSYKSIKGASIKAEQELRKQYPAIYKHLLSHKEKLLKRNKAEIEIRYEWYALQRWAADYNDEFNKEKIVYSEIVRSPQFFVDNENHFVEATGFLMTGKNIKYICGILNSLPVTYFFRKWYSGGGLGEKGYRYKKAFLENLPVPKPTTENEMLVLQVEALVDKILLAKKENQQIDTKHWENEIDSLVYKLYDLTFEEIQIIEENTRQ